MATIKLARTTNCNRAISYAEKRAVEKDGLNCLIDNAKLEMKAVRNSWSKNDKTQAHLVIQSFSPQESKKLGAEKAKEIKLPYLGNLKVFEKKSNDAIPESNIEVDDEDDNLPF